MPPIQPKQIQKVIAAPIKIQGQSITSGSSTATITSVITTILTTAGNNNVSVPVQVSSSVFVPGIIVSQPHNKTEIFDNATKLPIADSFGNEIYGRITAISSVYTLTLYYLNSGVETVYTTPINISIDFDFSYRFDFNTLPADSLISFVSRNVALDPKGQSAALSIEQLSVLGTNSVSSLANIPTYPFRTTLIVNGKEEFSLGTTPAFSVSSNIITWNAANAGYSIDALDVVYVKYYL